MEYGRQFREPGSATGETSGFFDASSVFGVIFLVLAPCLLVLVPSDAPRGGLAAPLREDDWSPVEQVDDDGAFDFDDDVP